MPTQGHSPGPLQELAAILVSAWPVVAGFAGSVLSLAFLDKLTPRGRVLAVVVGTLAAVFIAPALAALADWPWPGPPGSLPREVASAIHFLVGLSAMGAMPNLLRWITDTAGDPLGVLKPRVVIQGRDEEGGAA